MHVDFHIVCLHAITFYILAIKLMLCAKAYAERLKMSASRLSLSLASPLETWLMFVITLQTGEHGGPGRRPRWGAAAGWVSDSSAGVWTSGWEPGAGPPASRSASGMDLTGKQTNQQHWWDWRADCNMSCPSTLQVIEDVSAMM